MGKTTKKRAYKSQLRAEQVQATKDRILDAVSEVLDTDGLTGLTMPAVARAAGVSLPTVYRYFPHKRALVDAAAFRIRDRMGVRYEAEESFEALAQQSLKVFQRAAEQKDAIAVLTAALAGPPYDEETLEKRRKYIHESVRESIKGIRGKDRERLIDALMVLFSSAMGIALSRFDLWGEDGQAQQKWMAETLIAGAKSRADARARKKGKE